MSEEGTARGRTLRSTQSETKRRERVGRPELSGGRNRPSRADDDRFDSEELQAMADEGVDPDEAALINPDTQDGREALEAMRNDDGF